MKKLLTVILLLGMAWFVFAGCCYAEANIKAGYFLNYQDNQFKPVVATSLKQFFNEKISLDLWATDLDDLLTNISGDWEGGLALTYSIPVAVKNLDISIGYGIGARSPLSEEHEFLHGGVVFAIKLEF